MGYAVRDYVAGDEPSWLRCRVSSFLGTAWHDDAVAAKPAVSGAELVAVDGDVVVGILDLAVDGELATIETIAVHPDHQHRGIGGALLSRARARATALGATTLDAWTRDDPPTVRWYRAMGFAESDHHLRVIADGAARAVVPRPGPRVAQAFPRAGRVEEAGARGEPSHADRAVSRREVTRVDRADGEGVREVARADQADGARSRRELARVREHRRFAMALRGELAGRGDDVDHRAVAQDRHRQR
ncbi:GNAT family N-acetyltransferase [Actinosynnema sp. NPDC002837]